MIKTLGISNKSIEDFARDLGFETVPPMSPTPMAIQVWLSKYGALWVNGASHITVIAGIKDDDGDLEVLVYDPALPHKKTRRVEKPDRMVCFRQAWWT